MNSNFSSYISLQPLENKFLSKEIVVKKVKVVSQEIISKLNIKKLDYKSINFKRMASSNKTTRNHIFLIRVYLTFLENIDTRDVTVSNAISVTNYADFLKAVEYQN